MRIKNPTKDTLSIQYKGVVYTVEPESSLSNVPEEAAHYWRDSIHNFISLEKETSEVQSVPSNTEKKEETKKEEEKEVREVKETKEVKGVKEIKTYKPKK